LLNLARYSADNRAVWGEDVMSSAMNSDFSISGPDTLFRRRGRPPNPLISRLMADEGVSRMTAFRRLKAKREAVAAGKKKNHRAKGTGESEWFTPAEYISAARDVMGNIDLDPATHPAAQEAIRAQQFYTREDDALSKPWQGRVWLNPPYAQPTIGYFVTKLVEDFASGRVSQAIMLTHNYTETQWFHRAAATASMICFTLSRIRFVGVAGARCKPTQGQAFFYFGNNVTKFAEVFSAFGMILRVSRQDHSLRAT
jgi:phage N-6-adenine-methyltransferase